ncbi:MAG: hypothetical protein KY467_01180 [Gemmatimonadetes bacterium]|nr:hypothetical protein [Gemmatimonadota bacterium]
METVTLRVTVVKDQVTLSATSFDISTFGGRLSYLRALRTKAEGRSLAWLAGQVGVHPVTAKKWSSSAASDFPAGEHFDAICTALNAEPAFLRYGVGPPRVWAPGTTYSDFEALENEISNDMAGFPVASVAAEMVRRAVLMGWGRPQMRKVYERIDEMILQMCTGEDAHGHTNDPTGQPESQPGRSGDAS